MNKKGFWKVLMVTLVMASAIGLLASRAIAQNIPTQLMLSDSYGTQVGGTVLLDNFQYWNSPRDMGWGAFEPAYPMYGAGIGLGTMETIVDFQEGSRVMSVNSLPSTFMPMGGNTYNPYTITKSANYRDAGGAERTGIPGIFSMMNLQVKAPLSVEWFDTFRVIVRVRVMTNGDAVLNNAAGMADTNADATPDAEVPLGNNNVCGTTPVNLGVADIVFVPRDTQVGCTPGTVAQRIYQVNQSTASPFLGSFVANSPEAGATGVYAPNGQLTGNTPASVWVALGRQFQDGSWHLVMEDLQNVVTAVAPGESVFEIVSVTVRGNMYRMDDLMFTAPQAAIANNNAPYLFRIGPVYGQLFNTGVDQNRFVYAEDTDYIWLLSDRALLWKAQDDDELLQQLSSLPAGCRLATRLAAAAGSAIADYPFIEDATGLTPAQAGFNAATATFINPFVTPAPAAGTQSIPLFASVTPPALVFTFTVGDTLGPQTIVGHPIAVAPVANINVNSLPSMLPCMGAPTSTWVVNTNTTTSFNPMYAMACAFANSGFANWPTVQVLTPTLGQVLEDQIITCRVDDGLATDMETFPISVVNYPVTNVPPIIEQLEDRFFPVGSQSTYQITATDPNPQDMAGGLTYRATLNGLSSYQYGPWMEQIINPITGTITITPQFEATMTCIITVTDPRGAQAVGHFNIFCVNSGTWLNHAPAVLEIIESPQICRAGERFTISDLRIADPDSQQLYYSCNIGSVGAGGIWTFQSEYPGEYLVQITAYDIVGGAVTQQFVLQVMPWWSI